MTDRYYNKTTNTEWFNTYTGHELDQLTSDPAPIGDIISARPIPNTDPEETHYLYNVPDPLPANVVVLAPEHPFWEPPPTNGDVWGFDIDDLPELIVYAGSAIELLGAKQNKQQDVRTEFRSRSLLDGFDTPLAGIAVHLTVYDAIPAPVATVALTRLFVNAAAALVAIAVVDALGDVATVDAYDPVSDPSWSA